MNFDDLVVEVKNNLPDDFCDHVIEKFNKDPNVDWGVCTTSSKGTTVNHDIKRSLDLHISAHLKDWQEEDSVFYDCLRDPLNDYIDSHELHLRFNLRQNQILDTGYQIQRTDPDGYFHWHDDSSINLKNSTLRHFTYLWYLNTLDDWTGCTEFGWGRTIKPEKGKLILFPASHMFKHRGVSPSMTKYVCTGWVITPIFS